MGRKLTAKQQAQLGFLELLPPKLDRVHRTIEAMAAMQADEQVVRGMIRVLEEIKMQAQGLGLGGLSDSAASMAMLARRSGGGLQFKVRGLRELLAGLKINYDGAMKAATTEGGGDDGAP